MNNKERTSPCGLVLSLGKRGRFKNCGNFDAFAGANA